MTGDPSRDPSPEPLDAATRGLPSIICAWCGRMMRRGDDPSLVLASHGLCRRCANEFSHEVETTMPA